MTEFIAKIGIPVKTFYLSASPATIASRIEQREMPQAEKKLTDSIKVENIQRTTFSMNNIGIEIHTDHKSPRRDRRFDSKPSVKIRDLKKP